MSSAPFNVYYHDEGVFCLVRVSFKEPYFDDLLKAFLEVNGACKISADHAKYYTVSHLPVPPPSLLCPYITTSLEDCE